MQFPVIDYASHPAFAAYARTGVYDDRRIGALVRDLDDRYAAVAALPDPSVEQVESALREIEDVMAGLTSEVGSGDAPMLALEWAKSMIAFTASEWRYEFLRRALSGRRDEGVLSAERQRDLASMVEDGMYRVQLQDEDFAQIRNLALAHLPELRSRSHAEPRKRSVLAIGKRTELGRSIDRAMKRAGVLDVLGRFKQTAMEVMGTGLEYSRAGQGWHQGIYSDIGLADSPLKYLHVDQTDHLPKAMIYATPVDIGNGPTRVVPGSNRWTRSEFLCTMHKALDRITSDRYAGCSEDIYKILYRTPDLRRVFMMLPAAFQGSSHLGDDILPSDECQQILAMEKPFLPEAPGEAMVFDGPRVLHRGSLVQEGDRLAMQVVFENRNAAKIATHLSGGMWRGRVKPFLNAVYANAR